MQIYSGLVRLDDQLKPAPDIAERWQRSEDGKTYTFFLRQDVKFQNGKAVTAQDVKYSWERACTPATGSQTAATYLGDIVGANDMLTGKARQLNGVEIIDGYTLKVTIDAPKAYFLSKMAYPTAFVVDEDNVNSGSEWWRKPNGTGPFKLKEWKLDELLTLEPNESYYREPAKIKRVVYHLPIPPNQSMPMYEMDELDATSVSPAYIDKIMDRNGPFYQELSIFPEVSLFYIGFNANKPPFDDANVRRAFCHAVNKERIIKLTLRDMMTKADGILPPHMPGYNENLRGLDYDIAKAKDLLANSKYGSAANLPPIIITISGGGDNIAEYLGAIIQDWQQNLDMEVTIRQLEPEVFAQPRYAKEEADEMFVFGWIADYPDPQDFLDILFHTAADYNTGQYSNAQVDALLDQAAVEQDTTARFTMYQQAEQMMVNDAACLPLWYGKNYVLTKPYVKNYKLNPLGIPSLKEVYINQN
jgi:oligopeptide transport system substrate-binding protein